MIQLTKVAKQFPGADRPAVNDVSFTVAQGETLVLLGSSGCGKSTTLKLINGLLTQDRGEIWINGIPSCSMPILELRRSIGYVIQSVGLFPHWSVEENVAAPLRIANSPLSERRERSRSLLHLVGLDPAEFGSRFPKELSGGQQQRVGVARALATEPEILLMDEPFGALDGVTREQLQNELLDLKERLQKTIHLVTHDLFEALVLADRIGVMHEGRLEQIGTPRELVRNPATPFVRELFEKPARQLDLFREAGG